jgi:hypothetical protein
MISATKSHTFVDGFTMEAARSSNLAERVFGVFYFVSRFVGTFYTQSVEKLVPDYMMMLGDNWFV